VAFKTSLVKKSEENMNGWHKMSHKLNQWMSVLILVKSISLLQAMNMASRKVKLRLLMVVTRFVPVLWAHSSRAASNEKVATIGETSIIGCELEDMDRCKGEE
jgi:hypothetical protein